jgi:hypothetical protein
MISQTKSSFRYLYITSLETPTCFSKVRPQTNSPSLLLFADSVRVGLIGFAGIIPVGPAAEGSIIEVEVAGLGFAPTTSGSGFALSYSKLLINLYIAAARPAPTNGPSQYIQWYPGKDLTTMEGPRERAGLREPPVQKTPEPNLSEEHVRRRGITS